MQDRKHRKWYNNHGNMDGKQKYGKMQAWKANKSMGKCRKMTYNGENGKKVGKQRRKHFKNAGNESKSMRKCRIEITGNGIKTMGTWKAKIQEMSWEAEEMRSKCRNPGN